MKVRERIRMLTPKIVYPASDAPASGILHAERKDRRYTPSDLMEVVKEQVEVLYYAALVCGPRGLSRIDTRWIGFCPIQPNARSHGTRKTFEVDHETNRWYCTACRKGGDAIDLAKAISRCDHDGAAAHVLMSALGILAYAEGA
jgi:hypothetical protein